MDYEITKGRYTMTARIEADDQNDPPWETECGHGSVSEWTTRAKQPGERVLVSDGRMHRLYDFAEAVRIAKRDRWDTEPFRQGTKGQRAARAAEADFNRLRRWCEDDWCYVGVVISVSEDGKVIDRHAASLWGIESDADEYLLEVARDLAEEAFEIYGDGDEEEVVAEEEEDELALA
jgi:hypothetical protein